ncbi:Arogenate dehydrogenase 1 [Arachis hypogaea]|nr:Arogenate dehydrogenase 1 [Arachis hypogaea]
MFEPKSVSDGLTGLPFVFEKLCIRDEEHRVSRCEKFLNAFVREGCRMVEMSCEDHDRYAAGYQSLLGLVENTAGDSFDLYFGLFMFNKNSLEMLEKLDLAFVDLRNHALLRWARNGSTLLHSRSNDVAQLSSSASNNSSQFDEKTKLKFAIVGFGNFAQFLAKTIVSQGHEVLAYS